MISITIKLKTSKMYILIVFVMDSHIYRYNNFKDIFNST
jgi:hypothetical protein